VAFCYTNSKKEKYYLLTRKSSKGESQYFLSSSPEGKLAESIPEGYEIYENPNGLVYLRKIKPRVITVKEIEIVKSGIIKYTECKNLKIDIQEDIIEIYIADKDLKGLTKAMKEKDWFNIPNEVFQNRIYYSPIMQLVLIEKRERLFLTEFFYPLVSGIKWVQVGNADKLENHVKKYVKHINEDSYFEFVRIV